jgi:hypothetical protein
MPDGELTCSATSAASAGSSRPAAIQCAVGNAYQTDDDYTVTFTASDPAGHKTTISYQVGPSVVWLPTTPPDPNHFIDTDQGTSFTVEAEGADGRALVITVPQAHGLSCGAPSSWDFSNVNATTSVSCSVPPGQTLTDLEFTASNAADQVGLELTVGPGRYVAMGDSYSSGQGTLYDNYETTPVDTNGEAYQGVGRQAHLGDGCDRSLTDAYPDVLADQAQGDSWMPAQFNNDTPIIGGQWAADSDFVACNGEDALGAQGLGGSFNGEPSQLSALCATPSVSCTEDPSAYGDSSVQLITLTAGGDDEQFQYVLQDCTDVVGVYAHSDADCANAIAAAEHGQTVAGGGRSQGTGQAFIDHLAALYGEIHSLAPNARVLVLGYPRLYADVSDSNNSCKVALDDYMDQAKQEELDVAGEYLNDDIAEAVTKANADAHLEIAEYVPLWIPSATENLPKVSVVPGADYASLHKLLPDENLDSFYDAMLSDPTDAADYVSGGVGGVGDHAACQGGSNDWMNGADIFINDESYHPSALGYVAFAKAIENYMTMNPTSPLGSGDPVIEQGQTVTEAVDVPSDSATLSVSVSWPAGSVSTDLTTPSGEVIGSGTNDPTISYQAGATWEGYVIDNPEAGTWTVSSTGTSMLPGGEDVEVNAEALPSAELPPTAVASATPTSGAAPLTVSLSAQGSSAAQGSVASYSWNFGDGTIGSGERVTHTYTSAGVYQPSVTITDTDGNVASASTAPIVIGALGSVSGTATFPTVPIGQETPVQTLTLTSVGTTPLAVSGITVSNDGLGDPGGEQDVRIVSDGCSGTTLAPGSSCRVGVAMVPQAAGPRATLITFEDNGMAPDSTIVTGTGEDVETATSTGVQLSTPGPGEAPIASATIAPTSGGGTIQFEVGGSPAGAPVPVVDGAATSPPLPIATTLGAVTASFSGYLDLAASAGTGGAVEVTVNGTQVYGGTPTFTPDFSADPQGTSSTVTGLLSCSSAAAMSSTVSGGPYPISSCSGLSSTVGPIEYSYGSVPVTPAPVTITSTPSSSTMTYGELVPTVTPAYTGLANGDSAPATAPTCETEVTATSSVAGGPYATGCYGASDPDYSITYDDAATISVTPDPIVVNVTATQVYGGTPVYTPDYSAVTWGGGDTWGVVTGQLACSTNATASSPVGGNPYAISSCSGLSAPNYSIGYSYGALTVNPASTATSLTSSAHSVVTGQAVTYTATTNSTGGSVNPAGEGSVTFMSGSTPLCGGAVVLSGNQATCEVRYPAVGTYLVVASYSGGPDFLASTSAAVTEVVKKDATRTRLTVSPATPVVGRPVTLTATVSAAAPGSGVPTGTVTFFEGKAALGSGSVDGSAQATLTVGRLLPGANVVLTAVYSGDANYRKSTSGAWRRT